MEFVYFTENKHFSLRALCRTLAFEYGPAISVMSLQSAILARFGSYLPNAQFAEVVQIHKERAWRELMRKLQYVGELCPADLFAAYFLATIAWDEENDEETLIHYRGCLSIWHFLKASEATRYSPILKVFGPMVLDTLGFCDKMACITSPDSWDSIVHPTTTFAERVGYFEGLQQKCTDRASPGLAEAVHDLMDDMLSLLVMALVEVSRKEANGEFKRSPKIAKVVQYVKEQLSSPQFRQAVEEVKTISAQLHSEHYFLVSCLRHQLKLVVLILRGSSVMAGMNAESTAAKAREFVVQYKTYVKPACPVRPKYFVTGLMLAGMTLSHTDLAARKFKWEKGANM